MQASADALTPIHQLLARIRHDPVFGAGYYGIGYQDRFEKGLVCVASRRITWPEGQRRTLLLTEATGEKRRIPFHRIREVNRNGQRFRQRPA